MYSNTQLNMNTKAWQFYQYTASLKFEQVFNNNDYYLYKDFDESKPLYKLDTIPYFNGRERGFVVQVRTTGLKILGCIAFFEHRNADSLCGVFFKPNGHHYDYYTCDDIPESYYPDKYAVTDFGENFSKARDFIVEHFYKAIEEREAA